MNIKKIIEEALADVNLLDKDEIPNIDLYMDQVTTFMEKHLCDTKRTDDDKVLTKTMINNYTKNNLIPPPDKKKYSKEHVLLLTLIYYFKSTMSISDIKKLLAPVTDKYFHNEKGLSLADVYDTIVDLELPTINSTTKDIEEKLEIAMAAFNDVPKKDADYLHTYTFVNLLAFDIYLKKQVIESIIDSLDEPMSKEEKEKALKKAAAEREKAMKKAAVEKERKVNNGYIKENK